MRNLQLSGRVRSALRALMPAGLEIAGNHGEEFEPIQQGDLTARCHRDWPHDPDFLPQWNALLSRCPRATVFAAPQWQFAVADEFVGAGKFRVLTVWRGPQLLAVLPLMLNDTSMLQTPGRAVTDYLEPLVDPESADACWSALLLLLQRLWDWSIGGVLLDNIRGDSPLRNLLGGLAPRSGFVYSECAFEQAPYIPLPKTWEEYLATLDSHDRKELKRKVRNAQSKGAARWLTLTAENDVLPALDRALAAMQTAEQVKAQFTHQVLDHFLRRICPVLNRQGNFYMHELWLENRPSAWLLALKSDTGPMIYNTSYDPAARHWSPGAVCFALAIEQAIAQGYSCFNLLRGDQEYKLRLGGVRTELLSIKLERAA